MKTLRRAHRSLRIVRVVFVVMRVVIESITADCDSMFRESCLSQIATLRLQCAQLTSAPSNMHGIASLLRACSRGLTAVVQGRAIWRRKL